MEAGTASPVEDGGFEIPGGRVYSGEFHVANEKLHSANG